MFKILEGNDAGGKLKYDAAGLSIHRGFKKKIVGWADVEEIALVDEKLVNKTDSATFATVGALMGGPVGAAVGAAVGGASRPCTFFIKTTDGKLIATGWKLAFDQMKKSQKVYELMKSDKTPT